MASKPEDFIMPWGKHKGQAMGDILANNPTYLDWLDGAPFVYGELREVVSEMCKKYAPEIERAMESKGS